MNAIQLVDEYAVIRETCRGCGRCVDVCPQHAIVLTIENMAFVEESVVRIAPLVDVTG